jgi:small-conductance mechanosensitive channel
MNQIYRRRARGNVFLALWDAFGEKGISIPLLQCEVRMPGREVRHAQEPTVD